MLMMLQGSPHFVVGATNMRKPQYDPEPDRCYRFWCTVGQKRLVNHNTRLFYGTPGGNAFANWPPEWHGVGLCARARYRPHRLRSRRTGAIPIRTPFFPHQLRGSSLFFWRHPAHVWRTSLTLVAFFPNSFVFVDKLSTTSLESIARTQRLCTKFPLEVEFLRIALHHDASLVSWFPYQVC